MVGENEGGATRQVFEGAHKRASSPGRARGPPPHSCGTSQRRVKQAGEFDSKVAVSELRSIKIIPSQHRQACRQWWQARPSLQIARQRLPDTGKMKNRESSVATLRGS